MIGFFVPVVLHTKADKHKNTRNQSQQRKRTTSTSNIFNNRVYQQQDDLPLFNNIVSIEAKRITVKTAAGKTAAEKNGRIRENGGATVSVFWFKNISMDQK